MKLELKSVNVVTFAMTVSVPGFLLGLLGSGLAAFVYPFKSGGAGTLIGTVLAGTVVGGFLGFLLGAAAAWSYNAFASLGGGAEFELKEPEKDE